MRYLEIVESRIQEAMAAGAFANLKGEGKPLDLSDSELAGDLWLGYHLLRNARLLPPWLQLAGEVERELSELRRLDARHAALVETAARGDWAALSPAIEDCRREFEAKARAVRRLQDKLNLQAPGRLSERPGLWVECELERLEARVAAAGSPGRA